MLSGNLWGYFAFFHQFLQQAGPLLAKQVSAGKTSISANYYQPINAIIQQVFGCLQPAFPRTEFGAAGGADHCAASLQDTSHVIPFQEANLIAAVDHPLIPFKNCIDPGAHAQCCTNNRSKGGIHTWCVTAAGQYANHLRVCLFHLCLAFFHRLSLVQNDIIIDEIEIPILYRFFRELAS